MSYTAVLRRRSLADHFLRGAIALSFLYPPLAALSDPYAWVGYFPAFTLALVPLDPFVLLHIFGALEVALAVWLLAARDVRTPARIAGVVLLAITLANPSQFAVLFRDLALALAAFALAALPVTPPRERA